MSSRTFHAAGAAHAALVASTTTSFTAVSNTTSDVTLATLTNPAALPAAGDFFIFESGGQLSNNTGGSINHTIRLKLGATTVLTTPAISIGTNAADREWYLRATIAFVSAASQKISAMLAYSLPDTANWGGGSASPAGYGTAAENSASSLAVAVSVQPGTAAATQSMQAHWATLTRM